MIEDAKIWEEECRREAQYDSVSEYLEKQKRIKKELSRLKRIFNKIDANKKKLVESAMEDAAFLRVTMQDLRESIIREGTTVEYQNGENQHGTKQSPDAQLYLQMSQKQTQTMKILLECMPKAKVTEMKDDGFDAFVTGR